MDKTYEEEQRHLSEVYATICSLHDELTAELAAACNAHAQAEFDNATLRDKLGRMLDNAHEIERIGQI